MEARLERLHVAVGRERRARVRSVVAELQEIRAGDETLARLWDGLEELVERDLLALRSLRSTGTPNVR